MTKTTKEILRQAETEQLVNALRHPRSVSARVIPRPVETLMLHAADEIERLNELTPRGSLRL